MEYLSWFGSDRDVIICGNLGIREILRQGESEEAFDDYGLLGRSEVERSADDCGLKLAGLCSE